MISPEWVVSLVNNETAYFSPLDFRLTAALQFRALSLMCSLSAVSIENVKSAFITEQLVSTRALSSSYFKDQADALLNKFEVAMELKVTAYDGALLIVQIITAAMLYSAFQTNRLIKGVPGHDVDTSVGNCYPLHDNVNLNSVSFRKIQHQLERR